MEKGIFVSYDVPLEYERVTESRNKFLVIKEIMVMN